MQPKRAASVMASVLIRRRRPCPRLWHHKPRHNFEPENEPGTKPYDPPHGVTVEGSDETPWASQHYRDTAEDAFRLRCFQTLQNAFVSGCKATPEAAKRGGYIFLLKGGACLRNMYCIGFWMKPFLKARVMGAL